MEGKAIGKPLSSNATRQPQSPSFTSRNYYEFLSKLSTDENSQKQLSGTSKSEHLTYYAKIQQNSELLIKALVFLDSGASGNYIAEPFLRKYNIQRQQK